MRPVSRPFMDLAAAIATVTLTCFMHPQNPLWAWYAVLMSVKSSFPPVEASHKMKRQVAMVAVAVMALLSVDARSEVPDADRHEVLHLLEFLRSSDCAMERNGKRHESENAYAHVRRKYEYFRDKIRTSEDFIEYSASKSTMSGKYYRVLCKDEPVVLTRDWLLEELRSYRKRTRD